MPSSHTRVSVPLPLPRPPPAPPPCIPVPPASHKDPATALLAPKFMRKCPGVPLLTDLHAPPDAVLPMGWCRLHCDMTGGSTIFEAQSLQPPPRTAHLRHLAIAAPPAGLAAAPASARAGCSPRVAGAALEPVAPALPPAMELPPAADGPMFPLYPVYPIMYTGYPMWLAPGLSSSAVLHGTVRLSRPWTPALPQPESAPFTPRSDGPEIPPEDEAPESVPVTPCSTGPEIPPENEAPEDEAPESVPVTPRSNGPEILPEDETPEDEALLPAAQIRAPPALNLSSLLSKALKSGCDAPRGPRSFIRSIRDRRAPRAFSNKTGAAAGGGCQSRDGDGWRSSNALR